MILIIFFIVYKFYTWNENLKSNKIKYRKSIRKKIKCIALKFKITVKY